MLNIELLVLLTALIRLAAAVIDLINKWRRLRLECKRPPRGSLFVAQNTNISKT
jgi:hypothetical protein